MPLAEPWNPTTAVVCESKRSLIIIVRGSGNGDPSLRSKRSERLCSERNDPAIYLITSQWSDQHTHRAVPRTIIIHTWQLVWLNIGIALARQVSGAPGQPYRTRSLFDHCLSRWTIDETYVGPV
jgi:hypothetical protein